MRFISTSKCPCAPDLDRVQWGCVSIWMSTVKPVYKLEMFFFYLKWTTNTHMIQFTPTSKAKLTISMIFEDFFNASKTGFTRPNDGWTGLCIKLWCGCVSAWLLTWTEFSGDVFPHGY